MHFKYINLKYRPKHIFLECSFALFASVSVLLSNAMSQPTHISINKNTAILPQVPPSALNHTPCCPVRKERLSHDGQLCSPVQCCVCVWSGLWLSLSWIRPVMMNEACNITTLAGISRTRQCTHSCAKRTSFLHKHMLSVLAQSHGRNLVLTPQSVHTQKGGFGGAFNCDW